MQFFRKRGRYTSHKIFNLVQANNIGSCLLIPTYPVVYSKDKTELIGPIPKFVKYRAAIGCSIYNKETFNKLILEGKTSGSMM